MKKKLHELQVFEERCDELAKLAQTCKYIEHPKELSIPPLYPKCNHPQNRFKACGHPDDCPLLKGQSQEARAVKGPYLPGKAGRAEGEERTCKTCDHDRVIRETLDASEGTVDLTEQECGDCADCSNWIPIKSRGGEGNG